MWRLIGGELLWAFRQLIAAPLVLAGLVGGFVVAYLVLGAQAPGPVARLPARIVVAAVVGCLLSAGARAAMTRESTARSGGEAPRWPALTAAVEVASVVIVVTLATWLVAWGASSLV